MKKISVGSKNPVKIAAVENVVKKIWPDAEIIAVEVSSGVSEQPTSDDEAIKGASHRAKLSLQESKADLGIGLEGCTVDTKYGMFLSSWVVVMDRNKKIGISCGGRLLLPEKIAVKVRQGKGLGLVIDEFVGEHNIKQKQGTVGILTNGLITRTSALEKSVTYALAKFINPSYYQ